MRSLALLLTLSTLALPADSRRSGPQDSLTYIRIPAGSFQMGCTREECAPDSRPVHRVSLQAFWMGQSEVTVSAYREYARRTGKPMPEAPWFNPEWIHGDLPMVQLDWHAAIASGLAGPCPAKRNGNTLPALAVPLTLMLRLTVWHGLQTTPASYLWMGSARTRFSPSAITPALCDHYARTKLAHIR